MYLANAYPNSAISAGAMMAIAFVMVGVTGIWLAMVYLADRQSHPKPMAEHDIAEDEHSEAGPATAGQRREAAASR